MANIEYEVNLKVEDMSKATNEMLDLPIKIAFVISVGYLRIKCDNIEEAEKYLDLLRQEEIKSRLEINKPKEKVGKTNG